MKQLTLALLAFFAITLSAQPGGWRNGFDGPGPLDRERLEQLGLNQNQIQTLDTIWTRKIQEITPLNADIKVKRAQLARAMVPSSPNMEDIRKLLQEMVDLEYQVRLKMIEAEMEVRRTLGEDVWVRLVRGRRAWNDRPGPGGPRMGPRHDGPRRP